ncbi:unnamed protein product [Caenorhabditis auriculariae]|uniref:Uncharacterized protein n=1 Tax=Caenorhabditis auriculariae TaxID=2777116 RepID=A0A8S1HDK2_9PELO|nr:unnamed protein product [Caenorhabditis auriculariae]
MIGEDVWLAGSSISNRAASNQFANSEPTEGNEKGAKKIALIDKFFWWGDTGEDTRKAQLKARIGGTKASADANENPPGNDP